MPEARRYEEERYSRKNAAPLEREEGAAVKGRDFRGGVCFLVQEVSVVARGGVS